MMTFILNRQHKRFTVSKIMALSLTTGLLVTGCVTPEDADSAPHTNKPTPDNSILISQCDAFTPDKEQVVCTMQYDPVCVRHKAPNGRISYKTAGNACSACTTATAVSYTPGECGAGLPIQ